MCSIHVSRQAADAYKRSSRTYRRPTDVARQQLINSSGLTFADKLSINFGTELLIIFADAFIFALRVVLSDCDARTFHHLLLHVHNQPAC